MDTDDLSKQLARLVPKSLDEIVRKNRDKCRIHLATPEDFARVKKRIPKQPPRYTLVHWQVIVLDVSISPPVRSLRLVGTAVETGESRITSNIVGINRRTGLVETENSIYAIKGRRAQEKNLDFPYICAALNYWRIGPFLGVPAFFF